MSDFWTINVLSLQQNVWGDTSCKHKLGGVARIKLVCRGVVREAKIGGRKFKRLGGQRTSLTGLDYSSPLFFHQSSLVFYIFKKAYLNSTCCVIPTAMMDHSLGDCGDGCVYEVGGIGSLWTIVFSDGIRWLERSFVSRRWKSAHQILVLF